MPNPIDPFVDPCAAAVRDDTLDRGLKARLELMLMTGTKLVRENQEQCASTLLHAGISLIPSDHLQDHQFVVSRGVYEAAKRICDVSRG